MTDDRLEVWSRARRRRKDRREPGLALRRAYPPARWQFAVQYAAALARAGHTDVSVREMACVRILRVE